MSLKEKIITEGELFQLKISTTDNDTSVVHFTLDSSNYDINGDGTDETTPFKDKMLWITGFKLIFDIGTVLDYFNIDDRAVVDGAKEGFQVEVAETGFYADGRTKKAAVPAATDKNNPTVKELYGVDALTCRKRISLKASTSALGKNIDAFLFGSYVRRIY